MVNAGASFQKRLRCLSGVVVRAVNPGELHRVDERVTENPIMLPGMCVFYPFLCPRYPNGVTPCTFLNWRAKWKLSG